VSSPGDVAAHLKYYRELGVDGISRDSTWRRRQSERQTGPGNAVPVETPVESAPAVPVQATAGRVLELQEIRDEIGDCTRCKLHKGRTNLVFGVGDPQARLMFIGEGPGADEDLKGEPFVGRAGQLLTQIIKAMGLTREQVYIANVVKCRPPDNRNPEPDEIEQCSPFLRAQIASVNPAVIVALGKFAAQALLDVETPISRMRGQFHQMGSVAVMPTFHPSYLLRNPGAKREVWEDMKMVMARLANPPAADE
jgi:uracil-DNA glycosylase family 4